MSIGIHVEKASRSGGLTKKKTQTRVVKGVTKTTTIGGTQMIDLSAQYKHNTRQQGPSDYIDDERTELNYNLDDWDPQMTYNERLDAMQERMGLKPKKEGYAEAVDGVVSMSKEEGEALGPERSRQFFESFKQKLDDHFGADTVVYFNVQRDEGFSEKYAEEDRGESVHAHFAYMPVKTNDKGKKSLAYTNKVNQAWLTQELQGRIVDELVEEFPELHKGDGLSKQASLVEFRDGVNKLRDGRNKLDDDRKAFAKNKEAEEQKLKDKEEEAKEAVKKKRADFMALKAEKVAQVNAEHDALKRHQDKLKADQEELEAEREQLKAEREDLEAREGKLRNDNRKLEKDQERVEAGFDALEQVSGIPKAEMKQEAPERLSERLRDSLKAKAQRMAEKLTESHIAKSVVKAYHKFSRHAQEPMIAHVNGGKSGTIDPDEGMLMLYGVRERMAEDRTTFGSDDAVVDAIKNATADGGLRRYIAEHPAEGQKAVADWNEWAKDRPKANLKPNVTQQKHSKAKEAGRSH